MQQQESKRKIFEEYLSEFRDEGDALEPGSPLNSPCGAREGRWHAPPYQARHYSSFGPCALSAYALWRGVLSDDKNDMGIFQNYSGNIFCVTFSKTQKQSKSNNKNFYTLERIKEVQSENETNKANFYFGSLLTSLSF